MELYYKSKSTKLFLERGCSVAQAPKTPPMYTRVYKSVDSVRARGAEAPPLLLHSLIIVLVYVRNQVGVWARCSAICGL